MSAGGARSAHIFSIVLNPEGVIHWSYVSPIGVNPGADGILNALESLETASVHA